MKKYSGNKEPYIYGLFHKDDELSALEVLEYLYSNNYKVSYDEKNKKDVMERSSLILAFLSERMINDKNCLDDLSYAFSKDKTVIAIFLEPCTLTPGLSLMLGQTQGILKYQLSDDELHDKLLSSDTLTDLKISDQQKEAAKKRSMTLIIGIAVLLIIGLLIILLRSYILNNPDSLFGWLKRSKLSPGPYEIDLTEKFDPKTVFIDLPEDAEVSYEINEENNTISIYVKTGDKIESFEDLEAILSHPEYTIDENITVSLLDGDDLSNYVHTDPGVNVETSINEDNNTMSITLSKGEWTKTIEKEITIDKTIKPGIYVSYEWENPSDFLGELGTECQSVLVLLADGKGFLVKYQTQSGYEAEGVYFCPPSRGLNWNESGELTFDLYDYDPAPHFGKPCDVFGATRCDGSFLAIENGNLVEYASENEIIRYRKVDRYKPPYLFTEAPNYRVEGFWPYYEVMYEDLEHDYRGVKWEEENSTDEAIYAFEDRWYAGDHSCYTYCGY